MIQKLLSHHLLNLHLSNSLAKFSFCYNLNKTRLIEWLNYGATLLSFHHPSPPNTRHGGYVLSCSSAHTPVCCLQANPLCTNIYKNVNWILVLECHTWLLRCLLLAFCNHSDVTTHNVVLTYSTSSVTKLPAPSAPLSTSTKTESQGICYSLIWEVLL